jgi:DNA repair protein RecO (recombination protein O)
MADRSHTYRTRAVILRRRNQGDADRILTVFTPALGKRMLIAKGVRKTSSRQAGHLELFSHASLLVAKARTWDIITESVTVESFLGLRTDLDGISRAAYLCELVDAFSAEDDENQPLWELFLLSLRELNDQSNGGKGDLLLRWFELHLLSLMGFQPQFFQCLGCENDLQSVTNYLHLHAGGVYCPGCGQALPDAEPIMPDVLKVLRHLSRTPWPEIRGLQLRQSTQRALESILHRYLVYVLERRLKSADFLNRLRLLPAAGTEAADMAAPVSGIREAGNR